MQIRLFVAFFLGSGVMIKRDLAFQTTCNVTERCDVPDGARVLYSLNTAGNFITLGGVTPVNVYCVYRSSAGAFL